MPRGVYFRTEECRRNLSLAKIGRVGNRKGKKNSPEHRRKVGLGNKGKKLSEETKNKMRGRIPWNKGKPYLQLRGEKNPAWNNGVNRNERHIEMGRIEYHLWRDAVFSRDAWTCQDCGSIGKILNAHHIKQWVEFPELRLAIDNGITLCKECHKKRHKKRITKKRRQNSSTRII